MTTDTNPPGTAWMQIVKKKGTSDFATSFTADASLQTSALSPQQGRGRPDTHRGVLCRDEQDVRTLRVHCGDG